LKVFLLKVIIYCYENEDWKNNVRMRVTLIETYVLYLNLELKL